ncbi:MAG: 50S ribosomal protein L25, partial [Flavobacteriaceae bacterium]
AEELAFSKLVYTPNVYTASIELENGEKFEAILQDIQFHPVSDKILHIDFYQLHKDKEVTMEIPVRLIGNAPGVMAGGNLRFPYRKLKVRAIPANLPDFINADISNLKIGDKLYVTELTSDEYSILHPENTVVAQVRVSRLVVEAEGEDEDEDEAAEGTEGAEGAEASAEEGAPAAE